MAIYQVAPLVEAWIEIQLTDVEEAVKAYVAPLVEAWIEIINRASTVLGSPSLLSWKRGLKSLKATATLFMSVSLLSWKRGLKFINLKFNHILILVAPLVEAWIEIKPKDTSEITGTGRSSRGSVD